MMRSEAQHDPTGRLAGLDMARALAMVGMLMAHLGPTRAVDGASWFYTLPHGRASVLFMLVAGVGVSLMAASRPATDTNGRLLWRALVLLPLGLGLQALPSAPMIILPTYAVLFVLAPALYRLRAPLLWALLGAAALAGPVGFLLGHLRAPGVFDNAPLVPADSPGAVLHGVLLSGPHPVITWLVPFLAGLALGRLALREREVQILLVFGGAAAALGLAGLGAVAQWAAGDSLAEAGWSWLLRTDAHSQMPGWLWSATAGAAAILGGTLWFADEAARGHGLLQATGRLALTFYVGHVLALTLWPERLTSEQPGEATLITAALTLAVALCARVWLRFFRRGPLEMLLQPPRPGGFRQSRPEPSAKTKTA